MTVEVLMTKRDALISKIADSTRRLQNGDQSIEFQPIADMQRALSVIDTEIANLSQPVTSRPSRIGRFVTGEGL